ncbi:MAG: hypothetical protein ABR947_06810 [Solirubrobacteraceae bacterium]
MGPDRGQFEALRDDAQAGPLIERLGGQAGVAPDARGALCGCVRDQRVQHGGPGTPAARRRHGRHAADPPGARLAVGRDEADRDQLTRLEGTDGEGVRRLVRRQLLERLVRAQDLAAQGARALERQRRDEQLAHE